MGRMGAHEISFEDEIKGWRFNFNKIGEIEPKQEVNFETLAELRFNELIIQKTAELYAQIWQEPPWNEDFWNPDEVSHDIKNQTTRKGAVCFLASRQLPYYGYEFADEELGIQLTPPPYHEKTMVIGFTWGYPVNKKELGEIAKNFLIDELFEFEKKAFYIDELGVDKGWRGMGVGIMLSRLLLEAVKAQGLKKVVLRTDIKAAPAVRLYKYLGLKDMRIRDKIHKTRTYWLKSL